MFMPAYNAAFQRGVQAVIMSQTQSSKKTKWLKKKIDDIKSNIKAARLTGSSTALTDYALATTKSNYSRKINCE